MGIGQEHVFDGSRLVPQRDEFARYVVGELGDSKSTAFTYEQSRQRVERFLGKSIIEITASDMRRFLRDSDYHPSTKNLSLVSAKTWARFLLLENAIDPKQAADIIALRGPKRRRRMKRPMTVEEARTLLDACENPLEHRAIYPGLYQGLRVSDAANLDREWFRGDRLMFTSVKGDKDLELPLHPELAKVADIILERSSSVSGLKATCQSLAHYTGIPFSSHTLRHTYSRRLDDLGTQEGVAIELLGQEQITVYRKHYAGVTWDQMVEAGVKVSY